MDADSLAGVLDAVTDQLIARHAANERVLEALARRGLDLSEAKDAYDWFSRVSACGIVDDDLANELPLAPSASLSLSRLPQWRER